MAGITLSRHVDTARVFLLGGGVVYLLLWVYGLILGVAMIALGVLLARRPATTAARTGTR